MMNFKLTICCLLLSIQFVYSQVKGKITDHQGEPLAFAAIYVKGTTKGTSSNVDGNYELTLMKGKYTLVFQYLGYQAHEEVVDYTGQSYLLNVVLKPSIYPLREIIVSSNQEDPAYEIIRKAISKRKYYLNQKPNYNCNAYTKGYIKVVDAPKKIMGRDIGTMNGNLDTNRKGFVYLSETISKISFEKPDHLYEEMVSSIISGRDNGFSFNSASSVDFNLYENTSEFGKNIVSPIADNAFSYYKFKLLGIDTGADTKSQSYRIQLIPKNNSLGCWHGEINIRDGDWSIESVNLYITGKQVQQELFDTVYLRQLFIPLEIENLYKIQNQVFSFKAKLLGIKLEGKFIVVFSDYVLDEKIKVDNKNVFLNVQEGANEKTRTYWDSIRPVPLTADEKADYKLKDSIKVIRETKEYKDSVDTKNNQFNFTDLFFGYEYKNTFDHWNFSIGSPLELFHFNPVQGWSLGAQFKYNRTIRNIENNKHIAVEAQFDYGFAEEKFRSAVKLHYRYNRKSNSYINLAGGIGLFEFNSLESSRLFNEINNLYFKQSFVKLFEKQFIRLETGTNLSNDLQFFTSIEYAKRENVINHSQFSFAFKSLQYQSNSFADQFGDSLYISQNNLLSWSSNFNWTPGTKVWVTPKEITKLGSVYPKFDLDYTLGVYTKTKHPYQRLDLRISKDLNFRHWGVLSVTWKGSALTYNHELDATERIYQSGNALSFYLKPNSQDFFLSMYPYAYSSARRATSWLIEHDFQGHFLDRIPLLNKLGFKELVRYSSVFIPGSRPFTELSIGFGNVGYKLFRLFRVDCVNQFYHGKFKATYLTVGLISSIGGGK